MRRAEAGGMAAANRAGAAPATKAAMVIQTGSSNSSNQGKVSSMLHPKNALLITQVSTSARAAPESSPVKHEINAIITASVSIMRTICHNEAPMDLRTPISLVLSTTMMLIVRITPPTAIIIDIP